MCEPHLDLLRFLPYPPCYFASILGASRRRYCAARRRHRHDTNPAVPPLHLTPPPPHSCRKTCKPYLGPLCFLLCPLCYFASILGASCQCYGPMRRRIAIVLISPRPPASDTAATPHPLKTCESRPDPAPRSSTDPDSLILAPGLCQTNKSSQPEVVKTTLRASPWDFANHSNPRSSRSSTRRDGPRPGTLPRN